MIYSVGHEDDNMIIIPAPPVSPANPPEHGRTTRNDGNGAAKVLLLVAVSLFCDD